MKKFTMSILLAALFLPGAAWADPQTAAAAPPQTVVERAVPPQIGKAADLTLPVIAERRLDNGIPVYIAVRPKLPIESVYFIFPEAFCKNDPPGKYGLAAATLNLMGQGAGERDVLAFKKAVDLLGSSIVTYRGEDRSDILVSCLTERLPETIDLAADAIMLPTFPQRELDRYKKQMADDYSYMRTSPRSLTYLAFIRLLYGEDSRYGTSSTGTPQQVASLTRQDLIDYYNKYFAPDKMFICCCGSADPDTVMEVLNKRLGRWKPGCGGEAAQRGAAAAQPVPAPKPEPRFIPADLDGKTPMDGRIFIVDRPGSHQSCIYIGSKGITAKDPDRLAIVAMNNVLGGAFSSRLNNNLRERSGFTYGAGSDFCAFADRGFFVAATSAQTDKTFPAVREMLKEIDSMHQPVSQEELQRTLNHMAYVFPSEFITCRNVNNFTEDTILYGYPKDYADTYVSKVLKLTLADIQKAADRTLDTGKMIVVIVGDAKALEPQLKEAGWRAQVLTVDDIMGPEYKAEK